MTARKSVSADLPAAVPEPAVAPPAREPGTVPEPRNTGLNDLEREAAMSALFDSHHTQLLRLALLLGAEHDAEDLVSEAFCELHRRWRRLHSPESAPAYLRSTVCNLARMRIRHLQVRRRHAQFEADGFGERTMESAESSVLLREDQRKVIAALQTLSARQREALVLRYWMGLKESDIAESMGISVGAVKSHIFRGMSALAMRIEGGRR
ncbi:RNA polymerase sigma factor [Saccharopolyspora shandongensis]|uniref:RNA polymerase sigma factor n=1 Tax=Saccharopolyspora shandongensis TaxID=418495 RepID=UPI0033EC5AF2